MFSRNLTSNANHLHKPHNATAIDDISLKDIPDLGDPHLRLLARFIGLGNLIVIINAIVWSAFWYYFDSISMMIVCFLFVFYAAFTRKISANGEYYKALTMMTVGVTFWLFLVVFVASGPGIEYGGSVHAFFLTMAVCLFVVLKKVNPIVRYSVSVFMLACFIGIHIPIVDFSTVLAMPLDHHLLAGRVTWTSAILTTVLFVLFSRNNPAYDRKIEFFDTRLGDVFLQANQNKHSAYIKSEHKKRMLARAVPECSLLLVSLPLSHVSPKASAGTDSNDLDLLEALNSIYGEFDDAIYEAGFDKIDDEKVDFLITSGVSSYCETHASDIVALAITFMEIAKRYPTIDISAAIHSGAVTAGILSENNAVYSVWGKQVQRAQKVKSLSQAKRITLSQETYDLIKAQYSCEFIKTVNIHSQKPLGLYNLEI